jgi:hypothetical protein
MKTAVIAPSALLEKYATSDYHLCLCHRVLKDEFYGHFYGRDARGFVILDNSAHELGVGGMLMDMKKAVDRIGNPEEVVLPDRLFFADDTIKYARESNGEFRKLAPRVMGVPHGTTIGEWEWCCSQLIDLGVNTIGISKDYEGWIGGLPKLVEKVRDIHSRSWYPVVDCIHMLGWGRKLWQLTHLLRLEEGSLPIRGIDSGKPLVYAAAGIDLEAPGMPPYPGRLENFFELKDEDIPTELALKNINTFRMAAGDV